MANARQWVRALDDAFGFDEPDVKAAREHFDYFDEDGDSGRDDDYKNTDSDDGLSDAELGSGILGEAHGRRRTSAPPARRSTG